MDDNDIYSIGSGVFNKTPNLNYLDLSLNFLQTVQSQTFDGLRSLNHLNLSSNFLNNIDAEPFSRLNSLETLDLSKNFLYYIKPNSFTGLLSLKSLYLDENSLDLLEKYTFKDLNQLVSLNLAKNMLKILDFENFKSLMSLESLDLSSNRIKAVNKSFRYLTRLKALDLSSNLITELKNEDFETIINLSEINLSHNKLDYIDQNLSNINTIKKLRLSNTSIAHSSKLNIDQFRLEEIDLSFNNISFISSKFLQKSQFTLKTLNTKNSSLVDYKFLFTFVDGDVFISDIDLSNSKLTPLFTVITSFLRRNNNTRVKLSNVGLKSLEEINYQLLNDSVELDLSHNYLETILNNVTNPFGVSLYYLSYNLRRLDLSFNNISKMNSSTFVDRQYLTYINLESSFSEEMSSDLFAFNDNLEKAIISGNFLRKFPVFCSDYSKSRVCELEELSMANNRLKELRKNDLIFLKSLKYLNLDRNLIAKIEKNTFDNLINLKKLILSRNNLSSTNTFDSNPFVFKYLYNLKELNLSSNSIEYLQPYLFYELNKLTTIDLSSNSIRFIQNNSFCKLYNLKNLYLNNNMDNLTFESYESFNELSSIKNIYISKAILDRNKFNKCFFKQLFSKNNPDLYDKEVTSYRIIANVTFFSSINLLTPDDEYDCDLTLAFIRFNIQFNLRSDLDFDKYLMRSCESQLLELDGSSRLRFEC